MIDDAFSPSGVFSRRTSSHARLRISPISWSRFALSLVMIDCVFAFAALMIAVLFELSFAMMFAVLVLSLLTIAVLFVLSLLMMLVVFVLLLLLIDVTADV